MKTNSYLKLLPVFFVMTFSFQKALSQNDISLTLDLSKDGAAVSPMLYGLMTEEINYSYDGGLYAELIRNRVFKDHPKNAEHWSMVDSGDSRTTLTLDNRNPLNEVLSVCAKLHVENAARAGIANDGYWGIPVKPGMVFKSGFYARTSVAAGSSLDISIESPDGKTVYATARIEGVSGQWQKFSASLKIADNTSPASAARFVIRTAAAGDYWFNLVSLFPPTYNNRPNGNRQDIMQLLEAMKPAFLRFPGGNFLEGDMFSSRYDWKKTLGGLETRPGHPGCWNYRASDGMGLLEFLQWCEDLKMEPLLAVFAGYTLKGDYLDAGPLLQPFVDEALEEIEYVIGDVNTKWGAVRASNGHPRPFPLRYIEIGNEDGFDKSGTYGRRFNMFAEAIRKKYPQLKLISTVGGKDPLGARVPMPTGHPDLFDEHYYRNAWQMEEDAAHYDKYDRKGPKVFVGEWATREGSPTTNMNAALGDAAWMTGMERNSDVVEMSCYAPLFVNVNPGGMQWKSDLVGYNVMSCYGSPSYYAQKLFNTYIGDRVVQVSGVNIPTQVQKLNAKDSAAGVNPKTIPSMFYVATRNSKTATIYLKVVNTAATAQEVKLHFTGGSKLAATGIVVVLKSEKPEDTNTINEPEKIIPVTAMLKGVSENFKYSFPPYSITILKVESR